MNLKEFIIKIKLFYIQLEIDYAEEKLQKTGDILSHDLLRVQKAHKNRQNFLDKVI